MCIRDSTKTKVGFEIPFTRQFYVYTPPRPVEEIAQEIKDLEKQIQTWMSGLGSVSYTHLDVYKRQVYDPAAGTGGMLMTALHHIKDLNPAAIVNVFGQELNDETWAIAQSDLMMQDTAPERMRNGNSLTADAFPTEKFDYILANPPYGVAVSYTHLDVYKRQRST